MNKVISDKFGRLPKGKLVRKYILSNKSGLKVSVINYGGIITNLWLPDKNGVMHDIVLGYDTLQEYVEDTYYLGAIIGRFANRILDGRFKINGKHYQLDANDGSNHLHGGEKGFSKQYWEITTDETKNKLLLSYVSPDGDQGYPGTLKTTVSYSLTDNNELIIDYYATVDQSTIINLTQHSYFNLSGHLGTSILDHQLQIDSNGILVANDAIPTGSFQSVEGTPWDFNTPKEIGKDINSDHLAERRGYDHCYILTRSKPSLIKVGELSHEKSGRTMEVWTDAPGMQLYSGNFLDGCVGKGLTPYLNRSGVCLETQNFPDAPNHDHFPNSILRPRKEFRSRTIYKFKQTN